MLTAVSQVGARDLLLKSDRCPRYPKAIRRWVPRAAHEAHLSRRACVVGQGELKAGGFDPLFSLNHTCAMVRDNLKRLSRKTWCTTKRIDRLQCPSFKERKKEQVQRCSTVYAVEHCPSIALVLTAA